MCKSAKCISYIVTIDAHDFLCLSVHYLILVHSYYLSLWVCAPWWMRFSVCCTWNYVFSYVSFLVCLWLLCTIIVLSKPWCIYCLDALAVVLLCVWMFYHCLFYVFKLLPISLCCVDESLAVHDCYSCDSLHLSMTLWVMLVPCSLRWLLRVLRWREPFQSWRDCARTSCSHQRKCTMSKRISSLQLTSFFFGILSPFDGFIIARPDAFVNRKIKFFLK